MDLSLRRRSVLASAAAGGGVGVSTLGRSSLATGAHRTFQHGVAATDPILFFVAGRHRLVSRSGYDGRSRLRR